MNIYLKAYLNLNLGDDLFIKMICDRFPEYNFHIFIKDCLEKPFNEIPNLTIHKFTNFDLFNQIFINKFVNKKFILPKLKKVIEYCDHSIYIGGSLFMESKNWETVLSTLNTEIELSEFFSIIGCNFGPFTSTTFFEEHLEVFRKLNHISFRDQYSYELFNELDNVDVAPDIVFGLDTENVKRINKTKYVVISVIDLTDREDLKQFKNLYIDSLVKIAKGLTNNGFRVIFTSFCKNQGDEDTVEELLQVFLNDDNSDLISSYLYRGNIDETLELFANSSGVIATRFHSMILGWIFKKPTLPILYSNKMKTVIDDTDFKGLYFSIPNLKDMNINKVLEYFENGHIHNIDEYREKAKDHFNFLINEE